MSDIECTIGSISTIVGIASSIIFVMRLKKYIIERRKRFIQKTKWQGTYTKAYWAGTDITFDKDGNTDCRIITYEYTVGGKKYHTKRSYDYHAHPPYEIPIYYSGKNPKKHISGYGIGVGTSLFFIALTIFLMVVITNVLRFILSSIY